MQTTSVSLEEVTEQRTVPKVISTMVGRAVPVRVSSDPDKVVVSITASVETY